MFKINLRKWREDHAAELASPRRDPERLTKLYSIRAHARGRVHRTRARLTWRELPFALREQALGGVGSLVVALGMEEQAKYLGDAWKAYAASQEPQELLAAGSR